MKLRYYKAKDIVAKRGAPTGSDGFGNSICDFSNPNREFRRQLEKNERREKKNSSRPT